MTARLALALAVLAANVVGFIAFALVHAGRTTNEGADE
jgi:hypothetical protein